MELKVSILLVEDEPAISEGLTDFLEFHGFDVQLAAEGPTAQTLVKTARFDLILLDLMLPGISGEDLCTQWRREGLQTPIIMLTAKGQEKDRISGLNIGADDYVTKPFSLEELLARIRAVLRRTDPARSVGERFGFGPLEVDAEALCVWRGDESQALSDREYRMIQFFAANPGRVITREELYEQVWEDRMSDLGTRTVDMHIAKLRHKIELDSAEPTLIKTVRGSGYRYDP
ncbi:MAG: response regulator transcription factor [Phycisphaeraceae bacterium]|nr:response regulator transcription factor [Phycisphaeraceae bacterium]